MVLLEVFAYLTDTMIYRLNRLPDKVYIAFLRLLGVSLHPPSAASTMLRFSRARGAADAAIEIPRGTRVTLERSGGSSTPPIFMTTQKVTLAQGRRFGRCARTASRADRRRGTSRCQRTARLFGHGAASADHLRHGRPARSDRGRGSRCRLTLDQRVPAIQYDDKTYRIWREVENFANPGDDGFVYTVDRMSGTINFAPALYEPDDQRR